VKTKVFDCEIQVLFVPTIEIAKTLYKYRNSILKYNLRSFLELANNSVNKDIASSISQLKTNEFALYNNGITLLSTNTVYSEETFEKYTGQIIITQPQIINGGQTAYTLSRLYEDQLASTNDLSIFEGKEVLLKIIKLPVENIEDGEVIKLIETISKATNYQTVIEEADRRANDKIQMELQQNIYNYYGYFYERKKGEYADGIRYSYIQRSQIIDRETLVRLARCCELHPSDARRSSKGQLFALQEFSQTFDDSRKFHNYFFAFKCWQILLATEKGFLHSKNNRFGISNYGNGLRYGKFAIISACFLYYKDEASIDLAGSIVDNVLNQWLLFEKHIVSLKKNKNYFRIYYDEDSKIEKQELNYDNYYKGTTLTDDLLEYFKPK